MHSGGANTVLRNNRKLLKKRADRYRKKRRVMGYGESDVLRDNESPKRLTRMSASELKLIGRKYRRRRRVETFVFLVLVGLALAYFASILF